MQHRQSSSAAWPALAAAVGGVALFAALTYRPEPPAAADPARFFVSGPLPRHCEGCGWIEAKRELAPLAADPHALRIYEYTLRMSDGSMSLFQETMPTSWRLGERVMLIESHGALD
jgi:hypothetical protein